MSLPTVQLTDRLIAAFGEAVRLHADQCRRGSGAPYVSHPFRVAGMVLDYGADETTAIAALLHDTVEDQGGLELAGKLRTIFGDAVVALILECSDSTGPKGTPKAPWKERKERYLAGLPDRSPQARLIIACDKLDNLRGLLRDLHRFGPVFWENFHGGRDGTMWFYREVVRLLGASGDCPLTGELTAELQRLAASVEKAGRPSV